MRGNLYAAVDASYLERPNAHAAAARSALAAYRDPGFSQEVMERTAFVPNVPPYRPGSFYLRELPPLRAVLAPVAGIGLIVVDGYVDLDPDGRPGLGAHLHAEFGVPVVGVAKSAFHAAAHAVPVVRGCSARPLYVTAAGLPVAEAAAMVRDMAGHYRLPDALRRVDALARGAAQPLAGIGDAG